jgi:hypothetical protein
VPIYPKELPPGNNVECKLLANNEGDVNSAATQIHGQGIAINRPQHEFDKLLNPGAAPPNARVHSEKFQPGQANQHQLLANNEGDVKQFVCH